MSAWPLCWLSLALLLLPAPAAGAAARVADAPLHALAEWRGAALAVVESDEREAPFALLRSTGRGRSLMGPVGAPGAEFPEVAASGDRAWVAWGVPISGGAALSVQPLGGDPLPEVLSTGPGRLAAGEAGVHLAYPDRDGNAALTTFPFAAERRSDGAGGPQALTSTGPFRRHLPMDAAAVEAGVLVLDLIQERGRTELRLIGPGAPAAPVFSVRALRHYPARLAVDGDRVAVGWLDRGRARLATARLGGDWSRRRLPGRGRGDGAPAPAFLDGALRVAYTQRGDVYLWSVAGLRRLTRTRGAERDALAAGPYVGWTRRDRRRATSAWVERRP